MRTETSDQLLDRKWRAFYYRLLRDPSPDQSIPVPAPSSHDPRRSGPPNLRRGPGEQRSEILRITVGKNHSSKEITPQSGDETNPTKRPQNPEGDTHR